MSDAVILKASQRLRTVLDAGRGRTSASYERLARDAIKAEGGDPDDPLLIALVKEQAAEAGGEVKPQPDGVSWLYRVKTATGWPDRFVAELAGQSRATVQAYIGGRIPETLNRDQARNIVAALRQQQAAIEKLVHDLCEAAGLPREHS